MSEPLYCTVCDSRVWVEHGYDGYVGRCTCSVYHFSVGSGDRPRGWATADTLTDPSDFSIDCGDWDDEYGGFVDCVARCTRCGDDEHVTVEFERVDMDDYELKATLTCSAGHGSTEWENTAVVYSKRFDHIRHDFWPDLEETDTDE